jgi:hypothetical protein
VGDALIVKRHHALAHTHGGRVTTGDPALPPLRLRSIVLLAGAVSSTSLPARVGRSVLDLPIDPAHRLQDVWRARIAELLTTADALCLDRGIVVLAGESSPAPACENSASAVPMRVIRDESGFRGTAGALRDLCDDLEPDDYVLLGTASQCPEPGYLSRLLEEADPGVAVTVSVDRDHAPSGLLLIRGDALQSVPAIGFHDLKEQVLPRLATTKPVRIVEHPEPSSVPIRDLSSYVEALRSWHQFGTLVGAAASSPLQERWRSVFSLVEPGAEVHASARVHDSVVLTGAVVGANSDVVRSVIGPGGVVRRGDRVIHQIVAEKPARTAFASPSAPSEAQ